MSSADDAAPVSRVRLSSCRALLGACSTRGGLRVRDARAEELASVSWGPLGGDERGESGPSVDAWWEWQ